MSFPRAPARKKPQPSVFFSVTSVPSVVGFSLILSVVNPSQPTQSLKPLCNFFGQTFYFSNCISFFSTRSKHFSTCMGYLLKLITNFSTLPAYRATLPVHFSVCTFRLLKVICNFSIFPIHFSIHPFHLLKVIENFFI